MFLDAVERLDAVSRMEFMADMGAVVANAFGKSDNTKDHFNSLRELSNGE